MATISMTKKSKFQFSEGGGGGGGFAQVAHIGCVHLEALSHVRKASMLNDFFFYEIAANSRCMNGFIF